MALKHKGNCFEPTDNAVGYNITIGTFSSSTASTDPMNKLNSSKTKSLDVCCDDGGAALTAGTSYRPIRGRMLLTHAQSGDTSVYGIQGHLKNKAADTSTGNKGGLWGYYEAASGATVAANSCGVYGMIDVPSGATIGGTIGALMACSNDLGGTHTGKVAALHVPNPVSGTFDFARIYGSTTGCTAANTAKLGTDTCIAVELVRVGNTTGYVPILAAVPSGS
jgi:hypothetical protein